METMKPILTPKERQRFTLGHLVRAHFAGDESTLGAFRELSDAVTAATGRQCSGFGSYLLPDECLARDLEKSTGTGGYVVGVQHDFASALAAASLTSRLPLRRATLTGDLTLGVGSSVSTAWVAESAAVSVADPSFGSGALTPKTVATVVNISGQLWRQLGSGGQGFVEGELARAMAAAIDRAFVQGSGAAGESTGLLNLADTTSTSGTSLAWAGLCDLLAAGEGYEVEGVAFIMGVTAAKLLRQRTKASGSEMVLSNGAIDGKPVYVSRACPDDALLVAPFNRVVMASWGGLEVAITPFASGARFVLGQWSVRLMASVDFLAEKPALVGKATSIT
jgi:HK97 family phage major capsid protein